MLQPVVNSKPSKEIPTEKSCRIQNKNNVGAEFHQSISQTDDA